MTALPIVTSATGAFKPGFKGTATFQELITVYLGEACQKTQIPVYSVSLPGSKTPRLNCQAGRDFNFVT